MVEIRIIKEIELSVMWWKKNNWKVKYRSSFELIIKCSDYLHFGLAQFPILFPFSGPSVNHKLFYSHERLKSNFSRKYQYVFKGTGEENRKENHQPGDIGLMWHIIQWTNLKTRDWLVIKQWLWAVSHLWNNYSSIQISLSSCTLIIQTWLFWTQNNFPSIALQSLFQTLAIKFKLFFVFLEGLK